VPGATRAFAFNFLKFYCISSDEKADAAMSAAAVSTV
jgi:hypothetical protein